MDNNRAGEIGESVVQTDLLKSDFNISIPVGEFPYDLVVERDGTFYRVQVKTARRRGDRDNSIVVSLRTGPDKQYDEDAFDILAVYDPQTDECYYADWQEVGFNKFNLYVGDESDMMAMHRENANLSNDYTIERATDRFK